jgi:hypothetical protein
VDIISLGKASKVLRDIRALDQEVVEKKAEGRFLTVDARLDWLEAQASQVMAENTAEVDLSQKTFNGTQFKDGSIQLQEIGVDKYVGKGTWESGIVDLGEGWQETKSIIIEKEDLGDKI